MGKSDRNIYLETIDINEAHIIIKNIIDGIDIEQRVEEINVFDSLNRVTYNAIYANVSSPYYNAAAMDGICVKYESTQDADITNPIKLIRGQDFEFVNTGNPILKPYNAVIMIEDLIDNDEDTVTITSAASPYQHIRPIGEDIVSKELIIPSNNKIRPVEISAMIGGGIKKLSVYKKPKVAILPTGTEIIEDIDEIEVGKIIDSNSHYIANRVTELGGLPHRHSPIKDEYDNLKKEILKATDTHDVVIVGAGSSAGSKDFTSKIIKELGEVLVHGVAIKPGKPTIIGVINNTPIIGLPGYPVSTYIAFESFVKPLLLAYQNIDTNKTEVIKAVLTKKLYSSLKHLEFVRVKLGMVNDKLVATPLSRGAAVTMSLVQADGILKIDKEIEGYEAGNVVEIDLLKDLDNIKNNLVSIGSHDLALDLLSELISEHRYGLSSSHVGSLGGIMALRNGECHIAPIHLLDIESNTYNIPFIKKYFRNDDIALIKGIKREQGIMIQKGNPKNIKSIHDLIRDDVTFVNRQKGAGTRLLLDSLLKKENISSKDIDGYKYELKTHMMVASEIANDNVDCGIGIRSVANILGLDFIPIGFEEYDFIIHEHSLELPQIKVFLDVIKSSEFKERILTLGGYEVKNCGEIMKGFN